jgi:hypothetical protein
VLEAIGQERAGRARPDERTDASFLGAGEHAPAIVAERAPLSQ